MCRSEETSAFANLVFFISDRVQSHALRSVPRRSSFFAQFDLRRRAFFQFSLPLPLSLFSRPQSSRTRGKRGRKRPGVFRATPFRCTRERTESALSAHAKRVVREFGKKRIKKIRERERERESEKNVREKRNENGCSPTLKPKRTRSVIVVFQPQRGSLRLNGPFEGTRGTAIRRPSGFYVFRRRRTRWRSPPRERRKRKMQCDWYHKRAFELHARRTTSCGGVSPHARRVRQRLDVFEGPLVEL